MLTDQELQSLRNLGNEAEAAADEIVLLRDRMMELAALVPIAEANEREQMRALIADDAWALTFQTFGQYRSALLRALTPNAKVTGQGGAND